MSDQETVQQLNQLCKNASSFSEGLSNVVNALTQGPKEKVDALLKGINEILGNKEAAPITRFWALYLLSKAADTKNDNFAGRLARTSDMLQKIFKIAQQDYDKPIEERGKSYFKDFPNVDKQLGVNTVTLGMELIASFKQNFGSEDTTNARQVFTGMYNTLNPKVGLPTNFKISGKNLTINDNLPVNNYYNNASNQAQQAKTETKPVETKPVETKPVTKPVETKPVQSGSPVKQAATPDVNDCIKDGNGFQANFPGIAAAIAKNDSAYNTGILNTLADIVNKEPTYQQKFYTAYLLAKATEGKNSVFVESLSATKPLLNKLFKDGQTDKAKELREKGRNLFGDKELSNAGNNYMHLILEMFGFWSTNFTQGIYTTIFNNLKQKDIEFPKDNIFIGKNYKVSNGWECQSINNLKLENSNIQVAETVYVPQQKPVETKPVGNTAPVKVVDSKKASDLLKSLVDKKEAVRQYYLACRVEDKSLADVNKLVIDEYASAAQALIPQLDALSDSKVPADKDLNIRCIEELNIQQNVNGVHNKWNRKTIDFATARNEILRNLGEETQGNPEVQKNAPTVVQNTNVAVSNVRDERPVAASFGIQKKETAPQSIPNTIEKSRPVDPFSSGIKSSSSLKDSTDNFFFKSSNIKTPDRRDNDLFRSSTFSKNAPQEDLKSIENSIKHTFSITGKDAPAFSKTLTTPSNKFQQEKDELSGQVKNLQRENEQLKNNLNDANRRIQQLQNQLQNRESPANPLKTEISPERTVSPLIKASNVPVSNFEEEPSYNHDGYKQCKGVSVPENNAHVNHINTVRERVACVKAKAPIFENEVIQVGVSSSVVRDPITRRNQAKFVLFFGNKTEQDINDLYVNYQHDDKALAVVPVPFKLDSNIKAKDQVKQTLAVTLFDARNMTLICSGTAHGISFSFALPLTVLKFLDCKQTTSEEFRHKWKLRDIFVLKTDEIDVDPTLIKSYDDFKKYFPAAEELKAGSSKKVKYGIVFDLDNPSGDYLLRINILPNSRVVFQIASYDNVQDRAATVLQTLVALFKDPNSY
jgi:hypothetical protein